MTLAAGVPEEPIGDDDLPSLTADDFKSAFRHHPGGVAVVTAQGPDGHVALTATSVSSVSADPPLLLFSVSDFSSSAPTIRAASTVVVHLIDETSLSIAKLGATSGIDRFADPTLWETLPTGERIFLGTRWIRAKVIERLDSGTATVVVAQAVQTNVSAADPPPAPPALVYVNRTWHRLDDASQIA